MVLGEGGKPEHLGGKPGLPEKTGVAGGKLEYCGEKLLGTGKRTAKLDPHVPLRLKSNPGHIGER